MQEISEKRVVIRSHADAAWKEALSLYFKSFMEFCWPEAYADIDWSQGYEPLEQELQAIVGKPAIRNRTVDKLMQVFRKGHQEAWVLIHIEIQGSKKDDFLERLFSYRYRLHERFNTKPVATLVILTDKNRHWRPDCYYTELWGSSIKMQFSVLKLLDYKNRKTELQASNNPFAIVFLAQLAALETSPEGETRLINKVALTRALCTGGWKGEDIRRLFKFLEGILVTSEKLELEYVKEVKKIEEEYQVSYMTCFERIGLEQGLREGREQGIRQGKVLGESALVLRLLQRKFANIPEKYQKRLQEAEAQTLLVWGERILDAKTLEEVFQDPSSSSL